MNPPTMSTFTRVRRATFVLVIASIVNLVVTIGQLISPALWRRRTAPDPPAVSPAAPADAAAADDD